MYKSMKKKIIVIDVGTDDPYDCYDVDIEVSQPETPGEIIDVLYQNYDLKDLFDILCKKIPNFDKQMKNAGYINKNKIRKIADKLEFDKEHFYREGTRSTLAPFDFDSISDYLVDRMAEEKIEIFQRVNFDATVKKLLPKDKLERYQKKKDSKAKKVKAAAERRKKKAEQKKQQEIENAKKLLKHHGVEISQ